MAKLSGPMLSLDARGKFGGAIVFSGWKGIQSARQLVKPANPRSTGQMETRTKLAVAGKATKVTGTTSPFADYVRSIAPNGQSYASYIQKDLLGNGFANLDDIIADYGNVTYATEKGYADDAAADAGVEGVDLTSIGGGTYSAGLVFAALYMAGYRFGYSTNTVDFRNLTSTAADNFAADLASV